MFNPYSLHDELCTPFFKRKVVGKGQTLCFESTEAEAVASAIKQISVQEWTFIGQGHLVADEELPF